MKGKDGFFIDSKNDIINDYQRIILLCYNALIGSSASNLYLTLATLLNHNGQLEQLCSLLDFDINQLENNLIKLEQYKLINSYFDSKNNNFCFLLNSPLSAQQFFQDNIYSRLLLQKIGDLSYQKIKSMFMANQLNIEDYEDITHPLDLNQLRSWDENDEKNYQKANENVAIDFDMDLFLQITEEIVLPSCLRTNENLHKIALLASQFAIPVQTMRYIVAKSYDTTTGVLDFDIMRTRCLKEKKVDVKQSDNPYSIAPVAFLYNKQHVPVASADKKLIEYLQQDLGMNNEVTNALIEVALENTNNKLTRDYVEKVATSWIRQNITTLQQALATKEKTTSVKKVFDGSEMQVEQADIDELRKMLFKN